MSRRQARKNSGKSVSELTDEVMPSNSRKVNNEDRNGSVMAEEKRNRREKGILKRKMSESPKQREVLSDEQAKKINKKGRVSIRSLRASRSPSANERRDSESDHRPLETNRKGKSVTQATYEDDGDVVTLQIEQGENDFDELLPPPLTSMADGNGSSGSTDQNVNSSATIRQWDADLGRVEFERKKAEEQRREEKELQVVSKKIAGETFALVKEMMEQSGFFDAATMVKEQLKQKPTEQQPVRNAGESADKGINSKVRIGNNNL